MTSEQTYYGLGDDPVLGKYIRHYPSDRLRLLLLGGVVVGVAWFVTTVALWQVESDQAFIITVVVLFLVTLVVIWFMAHLWNREVVLYEQGFSYREGSHTAFILYATVSRFRQQAERRLYFGGFVRRTVYNLSIYTDEDEHIRLNSLYRRIDELSLRLEQKITAAQLGAARRQLQEGGKVVFNSGLSMDAEGLHTGDYRLRWEDLGGHKLQNRQIHIAAKSGEVWHSAPLAGVDNVRLLIELLREQVEKGGSL